MSEEQVVPAEQEPAIDATDDSVTGTTDLDRIRDLVLSAHPDVVPEMIQGESFDALIASIEPARDAYQRIASQAAEQASRQQTPPKVAAQPGQRSTTIVDVESLSPLGKISEGLRRK